MKIYIYKMRFYFVGIKIVSNDPIIEMSKKVVKKNYKPKDTKKESIKKMYSTFIHNYYKKYI
jgi:hypothetical protein